MNYMQSKTNETPNGSNKKDNNKPNRLELLARAITSANKSQEPVVKTIGKHLPEIQFDLNIDKVSLKISALSPYLFSKETRCDRGDEQP
ncbi:hypothetical protein O3M35_010265 [Rhynocoris fuscipes]|uniref:Uncharacterized protein n=1 Tax=Rhynocoris fuscipes TaxID=488301 RepID=A0AAW1D3Q6_9HEMI